MGEQPFAGNAKVGTYVLERFEQDVLDRYVSKIPPWLETYHLTLLTLVWSGLILLFSWLAARDIRWLWGSSAVIVVQYLTDHFDGLVGRTRRTGLVRWGYYMDHLLDFVFLCAVGGGYAWIVPETYRIYVLLVAGCFATAMVSTFLAFNVTNEFQLAYFRIGPTEFRVAVLVLNTLILGCGGVRQGRGSAALLLLVLAVSLAALVAIVYRTQKRIWALDMAEKLLAVRRGEEEGSAP